MKRQTFWILLVVVLLAALPVVLIKAPEPVNGEEVEIFAGADGLAEAAITEIHPDYKPWAAPLFELPSGEVESLLFALQAALGAGMIGYWLGVSHTRQRLRREQQQQARTAEQQVQG